MTLHSSLAERLGRISAAEAEERERAEYWGIARPLHMRGIPQQTAVERAFQRTDSSPCGVRRLWPEGGWSDEWSCVLWGRSGAGCHDWFPPYEHTLVMAPQVRAMQVGEERCDLPGVTLP